MWFLHADLRVHIDRAGEVSSLHGHSLCEGTSKSCLLGEFTLFLILVHDKRVCDKNPVFVKTQPSLGKNSLCGSCGFHCVPGSGGQAKAPGGGFLRVVAHLRAGVGLSASLAPGGLGYGLV